MARQGLDVTSFWQRTGALVSSAGLRRLLPGGGEPASRPEREPDEEPSRRERWSRALDLQPTIERARAFALQSMARPSVAVSAEGTSLRIVTYAKNQILGWVSEPLGERSSRGSQINDPVALGTTIDETFDRLQLPRNRVSWALSGFNALSRIVDVPGLRGEELRQAITEEVERVMGASASESFLYWQRLEGRIRRRSVFVLAIPRTTVLNALEALDVANIQPWTMDLRALALARAVGRADAIVVNLEEGSLDVVVVEQSVPTLIRSLPLPANSFTREAAQDRLVQETERTLAYYDDANPDRPLDVDAPLFLTGSLATGIGLAERLRQLTRHPIGGLAGLPAHPPDFPVSDYLVNVGLALKQA